MKRLTAAAFALTAQTAALDLGSLNTTGFGLEGAAVRRCRVAMI